ncbi:MAG: ABC transporter ATP-binding protein [Nitrospinota bacterium]|nr:MAG: ABC transporter ATP-binding protein [Nitrospinota bacterium]
MMPLFVLEEVKKYQGTRLVLHIPHLCLRAGRLYALTGPNGAGKTTLLRLLSFLDLPSSGRIFFAGREVSAERRILEQLRREVCLVSQSPLLFRSTVYQNVAYGLKVRGLSRQRITPRVLEALKMVGLPEFAPRKAWQLSGGEIQRVAIARALALDPRVLLLDEPMANVDAQTVVLLETLLKRLPQEKGMTVIFTSHNVHQMQRLADEVIGLRQGRLVRTLQENILTGKVIREGDEYWFDTGKLRLALATEVEDCRAVALSPNDIVLSREPFVSSARNVFAGRVIKLEEFDSQTVAVTVDVGHPLVVHITHQSVERLSLAPGVSVIVAFKSTALEVLAS